MHTLFIYRLDFFKQKQIICFFGSCNANVAINSFFDTYLRRQKLRKVNRESIDSFKVWRRFFEAFVTFCYYRDSYWAERMQAAYAVRPEDKVKWGSFENSYSYRQHYNVVSAVLLYAVDVYLWLDRCSRRPALSQDGATGATQRTATYWLFPRLRQSLVYIRQDGLVFRVYQGERWHRYSRSVSVRGKGELLCDSNITVFCARIKVIETFTGN